MKPASWNAPGKALCRKKVYALYMPKITICIFEYTAQNKVARQKIVCKGESVCAHNFPCRQSNEKEVYSNGKFQERSS